jgi:hypothetical protein
MPGIRMTQIIKDHQRLPPRMLSPGQVTRRPAGIAEMRQRVGFGEAVADFAEEAKGLPVTVGSVGQAAEMALGVAQAVPGVCLLMAVARLAVQGGRTTGPAGGRRAGRDSSRSR